MMKLSKGVLGLKFMRKTAEGLQKSETEKKHKKHFGNIKTEVDGSIPVPEAKVTVCPSYLQCERFVYARQSYGGMNPTVEENVRKGHWTVEYELEDPNQGSNSDSQPSKKKIKLESNASVKKENSDGEISDDDGSDDEDEEGMKGPTLGSLIGTIGKRFNKKHDKMMKRPHQDPQDRLGDATIVSKRKKHHVWNKNKNHNNKKNNNPNSNKQS